MPHSPSASCIGVRNLDYRYRGAKQAALADINIDVTRGSIFGLLGPNGAGKSTLLGILSGSLSLQSGAVSVAGTNLPQGARHIKRMSALVPQEYAFYEDLSGRENLQYFAGAYGLAASQTKSRIEHCASVCRLSDILDQRASQYSGGLKRRLNLAIGLLNEPQILYLDEPTVGIDAESRRYIIDAIQDLKRAGTTIIYTSHYMEEVEQLCDTVAVIDHGRVIVQEQTATLLQREGGRVLQIRLHQPLPQLVDTMLKFRAEHIDFRVWTMDVPAEQLPQVLEVLKSHGAQIERLQYGISRLEKIYLQLLTSNDQ